MKRKVDGGEQDKSVDGVSAEMVPVSAKITKGAIPLPDKRDEEFCQRVTKGGENPCAVYKSMWKPKLNEVAKYAERKMRKCKDRIDYLASLLTEEEKKWTTWSKEESTKELKQIVKDSETPNSVRIKAINELNTMYQHNNPKAAGLTIENKGIVFMARDGISMSADFLKQAKEMIASENSKYIDVTPSGGSDGKQKG